MKYVAQKIGESKLVILAKSQPGIPMEEAIAHVKNSGVEMSHSKRIGDCLFGTKEWLEIRDALPCRMGLMTAHVEQNRTFKEACEKIQSIDGRHYIEYTDHKTKNRYFFPVADEYVDEGNMLLVCETSDFTLQNLTNRGNEKVVWTTKMDGIDNLPSSNGWFPKEPKYGMPQGKQIGYQVGKNEESYFARGGGRHIGLAVGEMGINCKMSILLFHPPSYLLGLLGEKTGIE